MVRRGSTVRVRQRALQRPPQPGLFVSNRLADCGMWVRYGALTCGGTRWSRLVARVFCGVASLTSERTTLIARGRPALPRCTDSRSGDKMMIGCRSQCVCDRSVFRGRPAEGAGGRLHSGADRKHLRDEGQARWMRCDQAAAAITSSSAGASMGASASSPSSRRMWYARRQSLRATDRQARLWSIRCATCR